METVDRAWIEFGAGRPCDWRRDLVLSTRPLPLPVQRVADHLGRREP
jgi:hypothetical protein